jgi:hypothetical protein
MRRDRMDVRTQQYRAAAAGIDLQHLRDTDSSFAEFYKAILG